MDVATAVFLVLGLFILVFMGVYSYLTLKRREQSHLEQLEQVIQQINEAHAKMHRFDKTLESNLQNMEKNLALVHQRNQDMQKDMTGVKTMVGPFQDIGKKLTTQRVDAQELGLAGRFKLSTLIDPDAPSTASISTTNASKPLLQSGSARGGDWLSLQTNQGDPAGLVTGRLRTQADAEFAGSASTRKSLSAQEDVKVGRDLLLEGDNRWIFSSSDAKGNRNLALAPFAGGAWDWNNQFTFGNNGTLNVPGGFTTKGGKSVHNPRSEPSVFASFPDGKNYLRGDTVLQGELETEGALRFRKNNPGAMVEKRYGTEDANRYGMGQYVGGALRMYTSTTEPESSVNLSLAKPGNAFEDILTVRSDRSVDIQGPTRVNAALQAPEVTLRTPTSKTSTRLRAGTNPDTLVEIWGNNGNGKGEQKVADLKGDGSLCLGQVCMRDNGKGGLQLCNPSGAFCKNVTVA